MTSRLARLLSLVLFCGCQQRMAVQPFHDPYTGARTPVPGTVAQGRLEEDDGFYRGKSGNDFLKKIPIPVTMALLRRGKERFDINCSPCHGYTGEGNGMVVRRGFLAPPSYFRAPVKNLPAGEIFDVITHGHGGMMGYADRIPPGDRWAIIGYIRALQLSRNTRKSELTPEERQKFNREINR